MKNLTAGKDRQFLNYKKYYMYKKQIAQPTTLQVNQAYIGETIEDKINRIVNNNEPITDGAPLIYTNRKDGVQPDYNIRTDRFEVAVTAMDAVTKSHVAKREERAKLVGIDEKTKENKENPGTGANSATDQPNK